MAGRFSYSSPERRYGDKPWFRIGNFDVGTTVLVSAICVVSMFVWAIDPDALEPLLLLPDEVRGGQIWRLITWPLANAPDLWTVITIAIFFYFGRELEGLLGRNRFAWMLAIITVVPAIVATLLDLRLIDNGGLQNLELGVFLVFIAEYPFARFFFGIPGWVIGVVIVTIQLLQLLGLRETDTIIFLLILIVTSGLAARSFGLATNLPWIPRIPLPGSGERSPSPRRTASKPKRRRGGGRSGGQVVDGPWSASPGQAPTPRPDAAAAQAELDALLDKISEGGLDSLSAAEKRRLNELSKRLR